MAKRRATTGVKRTTSAERKEIARLYKAGKHSFNELARQFQRNKSTIIRAVQKVLGKSFKASGPAQQRRRPKAKMDLAAIRAMASSGATISEIAAAEEISYSALCKRAESNLALRRILDRAKRNRNLRMGR